MARDDELLRGTSDGPSAVNRDLKRCAHCQPDTASLRQPACEKNQARANTLRSCTHCGTGRVQNSPRAPGAGDRHRRRTSAAPRSRISTRLSTAHTSSKIAERSQKSDIVSVEQRCQRRGPARLHVQQPESCTDEVHAQRREVERRRLRSERKQREQTRQSTGSARAAPRSRMTCSSAGQ